MTHDDGLFKRPGVRWLSGILLVAAVLVAIRLVRQSGGDDEGDVMPIVPVSVASITQATLQGYVDLMGTVEPAPVTDEMTAGGAKVAAPVAGIITDVRCAEGQRVEKGAVLFSLDHRVADVAVARATQALRFAEETFARQKQLVAGEATSRKLYQEAEQNLMSARSESAMAEAQRALLNVTAPLAGIVTGVHAKPGDAVDLTTVLAEVVDPDRLVLSAGVRSDEAARVRAGQSATLLANRADVDTGHALTGVVLFVASQIDSRTDQSLVRVSVPRGAGVRPGQFLRARIVVDVRRNRLAVPVESVVRRNGASAIAIVVADSIVWHPVQEGLRDGSLVEVTGTGLRAGLTVVTVGAYGLPGSSKVRIAGR